MELQKFHVFKQVSDIQNYLYFFSLFSMSSTPRIRQHDEESTNKFENSKLKNKERRIEDKTKFAMINYQN